MYIRIFMHDGEKNDDEKSVLARATLNGLAGRVVARGTPVAHPWSGLLRTVRRCQY